MFGLISKAKERLLHHLGFPFIPESIRAIMSGQGATPTRAATCSQLRLPNSGSRAIRVAVTTTTTHGTTGWHSNELGEYMTNGWVEFSLH